MSSDATSLHERVQKANAISKNGSVELSDIIINQKHGAIITFDEKQIYHFEVYLDGVRFSYLRTHGLPDDILARKIIETFKFKK